MHSPPQGVLPLDSCWVEQTSICPAAGNLVTIAGRSERRDLVMYMPRHEQIFGVIRVIEDQITTLRPYNARYTGDHRSIFRKRYAEMITRVSLDLSAYRSAGWITLSDRRRSVPSARVSDLCGRPLQVGCPVCDADPGHLHT